MRWSVWPSPDSMLGWRGGEFVPVTAVLRLSCLVWNTGVSYGLLGSLPVWVIGALMAVALVALCRLVVALELGAGSRRAGASASAARFPTRLDRLLYGAVADFFTFTGGIGPSTFSTSPTR